MDEVERRQEDLAADKAVPGKGVVVHAHEPALADGRDGLQRGEVGGARTAEAEGGEAGSDGARRHDDDAVMLAPKGGDLGAQLVDGGQVDLTVEVGDGRGADLGDDDHWFVLPAGWYSNSMLPMCTVSPSRAPARSSARSTPRRCSRWRTYSWASGVVMSERAT